MSRNSEGPLAPTPAKPQRRREVAILICVLGVLVVLGVCFMIFLYPQLAKNVPNSMPDFSLRNPAPQPDDDLAVAARRGEAWAQHRLGVQLASGTDRKKNAPLAFEWFRKAAHQNHADAQYELGLLFENGKSVQADLAEAYYWILLSELNGNKLAKAKLKSLAGRLAPGDLAATQRKAELEHANRLPHADANTTVLPGN